MSNHDDTYIKDTATENFEAEEKILMGEKSGNIISRTGNYLSQLFMDKELRLKQEKEDRLIKDLLIKQSLQDMIDSLGDINSRLDKIISDIDKNIAIANKQIAEIKSLKSALVSGDPEEQEKVLKEILHLTQEEIDAMDADTRRVAIIKACNERIDVLEDTKKLLNKLVKDFENEAKKFEKLEKEIEDARKLGNHDLADSLQKKLKKHKADFEVRKKDFADRMQTLWAINETDFEKVTGDFASNNRDQQDVREFIGKTISSNSYDTIKSKKTIKPEFDNASNPISVQPKQEIVLDEKPSVIDQSLVNNGNGGLNF